MKSSVLGALQHLLDLILILILRCVVIFSISQMRKVRLMELKLVAFQFTVMELNRLFSGYRWSVATELRKDFDKSWSIGIFMCAFHGL